MLGIQKYLAPKTNINKTAIPNAKPSISKPFSVWCVFLNAITLETLSKISIALAGKVSPIKILLAASGMIAASKTPVAVDKDQKKTMINRIIALVFQIVFFCFNGIGLISQPMRQQALV